MKKLEWQANKDPRKYECYTQPPIDLIARVVCRREIEEARQRINSVHGRFAYIPSPNYTKARINLFKPRNYANNIHTKFSGH